MKQKYDSLFYTLWSAAIILAAFLCVFALIFSACARQDKAEAKTEEKGGFSLETEDPDRTEPPAETEAPPEAEEPAGGTEGETVTAGTRSSARLLTTPDAGRSYLDQIIFLGDSTTYGIGYYYNQGFTELCPPSQVWTPASGTLTLSYYSIATVVYPETGEELSIMEAVSRAKPAYLVITLGVNGISFMDEEWFIRDYSSLVNEVREASPETKVILNSMYPVAASYKYQSDINNDKIRAGNVWVEQVAVDTGVRFLNSWECLVGEDGNLPESYQNGDGLHLTGEAFMRVMEYIRTHKYP